MMSYDDSWLWTTTDIAEFLRFANPGVARSWVGRAKAHGLLSEYPERRGDRKLYWAADVKHAAHVMGYTNLSMSPGREPAYLVPEVSGRGLKRMPELATLDGGHVSVYESSNASLPCVWLSTESDQVELSVVDARKLAGQLMFLVEHHYQNGSESSDD